MNAAEARAVARELQLHTSDRLDSIRFHGLSLHPFLQENDRVIVEPVAWHDLARGDLITYRLDDKYPTRRAILKSGSRLYLWCENWPSRIFKTTRDEILGRAIARERDGVRIDAQSGEWQSVRRAALARFPRSLHLVLWEVLKCRARRLFQPR
jgi:hypothetical protein